MADEKPAAGTPDDDTADDQFDGAAIENIPPADSNEQLRIAHEKREAAFQATVAKAAPKRKAAAESKPDDDDKAKTDARAKAPEGRSTRPVTKA